MAFFIKKKPPFHAQKPYILSENPLALQQVDGAGEVSDADVLGKCGVLALEGQEHLPGCLLYTSRCV